MLKYFLNSAVFLSLSVFFLGTIEAQVPSPTPAGWRPVVGGTPNAGYAGSTPLLNINSCQFRLKINYTKPTGDFRDTWAHLLYSHSAERTSFVNIASIYTTYIEFDLTYSALQSLRGLNIIDDNDLTYLLGNGTSHMKARLQIENSGSATGFPSNSFLWLHVNERGIRKALWSFPSTSGPIKLDQLCQ